MMVERVISLEGGYVGPWSHCASWSCQRTHHHYIGRLQIRSSLRPEIKESRKEREQRAAVVATARAREQKEAAAAAAKATQEAAVAAAKAARAAKQRGARAGTPEEANEQEPPGHGGCSKCRRARDGCFRCNDDRQRKRRRR